MKQLLAWRGHLTLSLSVVGATLLLSVAVLLLCGYSPLRAGAALWAGSFGSSYALATTLIRTVPLLLTGLAIAVAFRCGALNIGAEGQLYLGALAAAMCGLAIPNLPMGLLLPALLLSGAVAGMFWGGIAGALRAFRNVPEVLSTLMLNFVALYLVSYAVHGPLQESAGAYPQTDPLPAAGQLPRLWQGTRLHWGFPLALLVTAGVGVVMLKSTWGFRMRAVGASPAAAESMGISRRTHLLSAMLLSGGLAGLAGAIEISGVTRRLYENFSPGYGFTAIAVALLARLHPAALPITALLFGALEAGSLSLQSTAGIPRALVEILKGAIILFAVGAGLYESRHAKPRPE